MSEIKKPDYKETWFWFVLAPLIVVVFVAFTLLAFSVIGGDDRISGDYYKQGRMINNRFAAEHLASEFGVRGDLQFDNEAGTLVMHLQGRSRPEHVTVLLSHPAEADMDTTVVLSKKGAGLYEGYIPAALRGRWYLLVESAATESGDKWRVGTEINLDQSHSVEFAAQPLPLEAEPPSHKSDAVQD